MPQMGYDMQEGTVVRWLMSEGSEVKVGDPVAEIETDKAVVEFESTADGLLRTLLVSEGTVVQVGRPIAIVGAEDEEIPEPVEEPEQAAAPEETADQEPAAIPLPPAAAEPVVASDAVEVRASPVARRLADEGGIDLRLITGTGPGGRITKDDVQSFEPPEQPAETVAAPDATEAAPGPPAPEAAPPATGAVAGEKTPLTRMRQQIARVTVKSKQEIPHFYVSAEIDVSEAMELRQRLNADVAEQGIRITVNDMVIKACVGALKKYPKFNSSFAGDGLQMNESINIGIAIAEEEGLIVPAILDCGDKSLAEVSAASKDLVRRSQSGTLHPQEYTGGTFSISNMGMFDVSSFVAIIHPPNAAVLAVGQVAERPVVRDGEIGIARIMSTTLSVDHRVADGAEGARFIVEVKGLLENPLSLLV